MTKKKEVKPPRPRSLERQLDDAVRLLYSSCTNALDHVVRLDAENHVWKDKRMMLSNLLDMRECCRWELEILKEMEKRIREQVVKGTPKRKRGAKP